MKAPTKWTRWPNLAAVGCVLAAAIGLLVIFYNSTPPSYAGESLSEWLAWFDDPASLAPEQWQERLQRRVEATHALRQMGTNALFELRRMLRPDSGARKFLHELAREFRREDVPAGAAVPLSPEEARMLRAVEACSALGREAKSLTPDLLQVLKHNPYSNVRSRAAYALGEIGGAPEEVVPVLLQSLRNHADGNVLIALGKYGAEAEEAVPTIMALLDGQVTSAQKHASFDRIVLYEAAQALYQIAPHEAEKRLPVLREILQAERDPFWRPRLGRLVNVISASSADRKRSPTRGSHGSAGASPSH